MRKLKMQKTKIDCRYIAGFFDGEGSAMIVTIKIKCEKHWRWNNKSNKENYILV